MAMRLGFSIATQVEPEVLIIDEALSVGDGYFQKKCMDRLLQLPRPAARSSSARTPCTTCRPSAGARSGCATGGPRRWGRRSRWSASTRTTCWRRAWPAGELPPTRCGRAGAHTAVARRGSAATGRARRPAPLYRHGDTLGPRGRVGIGRPGARLPPRSGDQPRRRVEVCSFATHLDGLPPAAGERHYRRGSRSRAASGQGRVHGLRLPARRGGAPRLRPAHPRRAFTVETPPTPSVSSTSITPGRSSRGAARGRGWRAGNAGGCPP